MPETTGHILEIGDHVKMNIEFIGNNELDGIEITKTGFNYWRYMCQHPDEVYTITGIDATTDEDEATYKLSGVMSENNWYSDELILMPTPKNRFEKIKNMTLQEMTQELIPMIIYDLCKDGIPEPEDIKKWLSEKHPTGKDTTQT